MSSFTCHTFMVNALCCREAVEHFLTALQLQQPMGATQRHEQSKLDMSEEIWSCLRRALTNIDRGDLLEYVQSRDLKFLMKEFNIF